MKKIIYIVIIVAIIALGAWYATSRSDAPETAPEENLVSSVTYACNEGKTIDASYFEGEAKPSENSDMPPVPGGSVKIDLSDGRSMTLPQTISADGTRYANGDESFVFWSKGNGALVLENNEQKSYIGCVVLAPESSDGNLSKFYANGQEGFSVRLPSLATAGSAADADSFTVDESYKYQSMGPGKEISGIKFTIPASLAEGTNLSPDSYIAVEQKPQTANCTADAFIDASAAASTVTVTDGDTTYSVASSTGAAAGNRYEETIYAIPGTNPCIAVRYLIHYGVFGNYEPGTVTEFDKEALIRQFNQIRRTLVVNQ